MKKLVIALLVVIGLLVAADFAASSAAERLVAERLRTQLHLEQNPDVTVHGGFPFLAQVFNGDYKNVEITAPSVRAGALHDIGVTANLHHARVPFSEIMNRNINKIDVDRATGQFRLKAADVGQMIAIPDLKVEPGPPGLVSADAGDKQAPVKLSGTIEVFGIKFVVTVSGVMAVVDGKLEVQPKDMQINSSLAGDLPLSEGIKRSALEKFRTTIDPSTLPFRVTPTGVRVEHGSLLVTGEANNLVMDSSGVTTR